MALRRSVASIARFAIALTLAGCSSSSSPSNAQAYVKNGFDPGAAAVGVFKVSFRGTTIAGPLADGQESAPVVVGAGTEYAYALVSYGWKSGDPTPAQLAVVRTRWPIATADDRSVPIVISFADAVGPCGSPALGADEYASIAAAHFPGDALLDYASVVCPVLATADAGVDATASDAGVDATSDAADAADATSDAADAADATSDAAEVGVADASDAG